jgi:hypothetical protein
MEKETLDKYLWRPIIVAGTAACLYFGADIIRMKWHMAQEDQLERAKTMTERMERAEKGLPSIEERLDAPTMKEVLPAQYRALENSATNPNMPYMNVNEFGGMEKEAMKGLDKNGNSITNPFAPESNESKPIKQTNSQEKSYVNSSSRNRIDSVISNEFFRNSQYMNEDQIRTLLAESNSCLQNTGIEKTIMQAAQKYEVNPAYLLGRLQQEKGLVTKQRASKRDLKYATGYGALDNGRKLPSGGLHSQVRNTAERLNELANEFDGTQTVTVDYGSKTIAPETAVEYALLTYTPHTKGLKLTEKVVAGLAKRSNN